MAIKLDMLRYFVAVARCGNLTEAARSLGRTPSAVSMMLKQFETHLNQPLFESERKSKLTAVGQFIFEEASREMDHFERTVSTMERFTRAETGYVRIAAVPSVANTLLPSVIKQFITKHPNIHIDVRDTDSEGVFSDLQNDRVDIGLASKTNTSENFIHLPFISDDYGVVCNKEHPLAREQNPIDVATLEEYSFISSGLTDQLNIPEFNSILSNSSLMARNTSSLLALVRAGVGITLLPQLAINNDRDQLSFLNIADHKVRRQINIIRRANSNLSPASSEFIDILQSFSSARTQSVA